MLILTIGGWSKLEGHEAAQLHLVRLSTSIMRVVRAGAGRADCCRSRPRSAILLLIVALIAGTGIWPARAGSTAATTGFAPRTVAVRRHRA